MPVWQWHVCTQSKISVFSIDILRYDKKISPIAMPRPEPEDASMSKIIDRNALWYIKQKGKLLTESK
ncbi:hypothetical protein P9873_01490 [Bacillus siamensis]|uniref:hypothetical protein n=1 Tax=Bacillus siamensis TaxID=659243 RepID=UPI002E228D8E|nr:hypothetical protein [Bacillus siamensis]